MCIGSILLGVLLGILVFVWFIWATLSIREHNELEDKLRSLENKHWELWNTVRNMKDTKKGKAK